MNHREAKKEHGGTPPSTERSIPRLIDETVSATWDDVKTIIDAKIEILKIEISEKIAIVAAMLILSIVLVAGSAYLVTTLALLAGELTGHIWLGYLMVSMAFIATFIFFARFKPQLLKNLIQKILLSLYDYKK